MESYLKKYFWLCFSLSFLLVIEGTSKSSHNKLYPGCKLHKGTRLICTRLGWTKFPEYLEPTIRYLDISWNNITKIPVLNATKLVTLKASHNAISDIAFQAFKNLNNLVKMDLSFNEIKGDIIDEDFFTGCNSLKTIILSNNPLKYLRENAFLHTELIDVETIELDSCGLSQIDEFAMVGLFKLTRLSLRNNNMNEKTAQPAFDFLDSLKYLDVGNNSFTRLNGELFRDLVKLDELRLDGNRITVLNNASLTNVAYLKVLNLANNRMRTFPAFALQPFIDLRLLNLSSNPIEDIKTEGTKLSIDTVLLDNLSSIQSIRPNAFIGIRGLKTLSISKCPQLMHIHEDALRGTKLTNLNLANNHFWNLPENLVEWSELDHLFLESNPWSCDCKLKWLVKLAHDLQLNSTCDRPREQRGKSLREIKPGSLTCVSSAARTVLLALSVVAGIVLLGVLGFVLYRWQIKVETWWRHIWRRMMTKCCVRRDYSGGGGYTSVHIYSNNIDEPTVSMITKERDMEEVGDEEEDAKCTDELDVKDDPDVN